MDKNLLPKKDMTPGEEFCWFVACMRAEAEHRKYSRERAAGFISGCISGFRASLDMNGIPIPEEVNAMCQAGEAGNANLARLTNHYMATTRALVMMGGNRN